MTSIEIEKIRRIALQRELSDEDSIFLMEVADDLEEQGVDVTEFFDEF